MLGGSHPPGVGRPAPVPGAIFPYVDRLRREEIEEARNTPPEEKARQALDLMRAGIELKLAGLRARHPEATDQEIEALLEAWLGREDG